MPDHARAEGGTWISLMGSGLFDAQSVLVDGRKAQIQPSDDWAVQVCIPKTSRDRPAGDEAWVDVEVRTPWGRVVERNALLYEW